MLAQSTIIAEIGRQLSPPDLALLATTKVGSETPKLKKIRAVHHAAARLMATGMKMAEVSMNVGLCISRLSILKNDPAFSDLIKHYEAQEEERFGSVQDRMVMLGMVAAEEISDRILDEPDQVSTKDLTEILKHALDRGGFAPVTKSESKSTHLILSADDLNKIKQSTQESANGRVIHRRPTKTLPSDSVTIVSRDAVNIGAVQSSEETPRLTLEGLDL